ncbi:hypothetical protein [Enterococcus malodoratus]|uniref:DUF5648 domain-containing protein n=1 Tax=Enterococcus malodoratus ATCC 43197 TaxID=1158601 RepID=R2REJ1_9ENTE|nr:hypothetical protein [Enterococcus malodoratus]EOH74394.1 hypothetical protein UAI_03463 [Enterococcus malodoratus ATCC 43197]EOT67124.1 hypothetical protein I585_02645 [Enterococcus malodoratus ATCC 43197]SET78034.1 hypothetical protein SAMN04487821_12224 [Enterococcus malodoratus]SPW90997.1 mannosyl-glycoprotein endo-beta-N-acetylglucosaminidase [Enterococcus malodoratus]STD69624.1 mannosyl-glycoprotein endo-beta-N-acetylglucosaminidase [Enterococcus malodoratus]
MKKKNLSIIMMVMIVGLCLLGAVGFGSKADAAESPRTTINRLYNPNSGEHLFTPSDFERATLINFGWKDEGIGFYGQGYTTEKTSYVSRVYNPNAGDHHYTASNDEVQHLVKVGWHDDNIGFHMPFSGGQPVYRLYNPNATAGAHHFTLLKSERDHLIKVGWKDEGIAFNAYDKLQ